MACGCPVACSAREGLAEACGEAALTFDPLSVAAIADALDHITRDDELRRRLIAAGPVRAARFRWPTAAAAHAAVYRRTAARAAG
jgi:glycosyltransferase involved in cell wall biosynthesis